MKSMFQKKIIGFSYIEVILVAGIISVLSTFTLISYRGTQENSRDTSRKNDLKQYQTILETQANNNGGFFPGRSTTAAAATALCSDLGLADCPADIYDGENRCHGALCRYFYQSNGACNDGTDCGSRYVLYAALEKSSNYFVVCSSGVSGEIVNTTTFSTGGCPL